MKPNRLQNPTGIRFAPHDAERIQNVARRYGVKCADIIRFAVRRQIVEFERTGKINIPELQ